MQDLANFFGYFDGSKQQRCSWKLVYSGQKFFKDKSAFVGFCDFRENVGHFRSDYRP